MDIALKRYMIYYEVDLIKNNWHLESLNFDFNLLGCTTSTPHKLKFHLPSQISNSFQSNLCIERGNIKYGI